MHEMLLEQDEQLGVVSKHSNQETSGHGVEGQIAQCYTGALDHRAIANAEVHHERVKDSCHYQCTWQATPCPRETCYVLCTQHFGLLCVRREKVDKYLYPHDNSIDITYASEEAGEDHDLECRVDLAKFIIRLDEGGEIGDVQSANRLHL